jgi:hypothetical protein
MTTEWNLPTLRGLAFKLLSFLVTAQDRRANGMMEGGT